MRKKIYFDHAATTPVDPEVFRAMRPWFTERFGNASSVHSFGQVAEKAVVRAREQLAGYFGSLAKEVIFTSGATESNNLALKGLVEALGSGEIITSQFEHPAILEVCKYLADRGAKVIYLPPNKDGLLTAGQIKEAISDQTILVSAMYANNEIGTIQPIAEIGAMLEKLNRVRQARGQKRIYFHTDATQAVAYNEMDIKKLGVDLLSLSGHKIYGPKGIGALIVRNGTPLKRIQQGGHHEQGFRAGTLNVPGIVGLGKAIELLSHKGAREKINKRLTGLRNRLKDQIIKQVPEVVVNGTMEQRLPGNLNVTFKYAEGESILLALDDAGIAVSTGSACASGSLAPSHVLLAIGVPPELAHGSIRITLGQANSLSEVNYFLKVIVPIINKLRAMSPVTPDD